MRIFRAAQPSVSQPEFSESAVRRTWVPSALLVAATVAVGVLSYSLSMQVATERRQTEGLARTNAELAATLKSLDAELRVRMRLPQLQRWNDEVLGLMPINATQYLNDPLQLAAYATAAPVAPPPRVQYAVRDLAPPRAPSAPAPLREVRAETPAPAPAPTPTPTPAPRPRLVSAPAPAAQPAPQRIAYVRPARTTADAGSDSAADAHGIARPQEAPADLLAQIAVTFAGPPGRSFEP